MFWLESRLIWVFFFSLHSIRGSSWFYVTIQFLFFFSFRKKIYNWIELTWRNFLNEKVWNIDLINIFKIFWQIYWIKFVVLNLTRKKYRIRLVQRSKICVIVRLTNNKVSTKPRILIVGAVLIILLHKYWYITLCGTGYCVEIWNADTNWFEIKYQR